MHRLLLWVAAAVATGSLAVTAFAQLGILSEERRQSCLAEVEVEASALIAAGTAGETSEFRGQAGEAVLARAGEC